MGDNQKQGFLVKEGGNWKTWKKRFFVLKNEELCYSKDIESNRLGVINMEHIKAVTATDYKKKKHCFQVETPKRIYYFCAASDTERDEWMRTIQDESDRVLERGKYAKLSSESGSHTSNISDTPAPAPAEGTSPSQIKSTITQPFVPAEARFFPNLLYGLYSWANYYYSEHQPESKLPIKSQSTILSFLKLLAKARYIFLL